MLRRFYRHIFNVSSYRHVDNWHKLPYFRDVLCKIGRHDWGGPTQFDVGISRVMLTCFYCSAQKSTTGRVLEKITCPECHWQHSDDCPLCKGRGSVTITENNAWLLGDKEGAKQWRRTLEG